MTGDLLLAWHRAIADALATTPLRVTGFVWDAVRQLPEEIVWHLDGRLSKFTAQRAYWSITTLAVHTQTGRRTGHVYLATPPAPYTPRPVDAVLDALVAHAESSP